MKPINEITICLSVSLIAHAGLIGAGVFQRVPEKLEVPFEIKLDIEEEKLPERYEVKEEKMIENRSAGKQETPAAKKKDIVENEEVVGPVEGVTSVERPPEPEKNGEEFKRTRLRYQDSIKQKIQREKRYPRWALRAGKEGEARIRFKVLRSGRISGLELAVPSGEGELDKEALAAVNRACPFLPFPEGFTEEEMQFEVNIVFSIHRGENR